MRETDRSEMPFALVEVPISHQMKRHVTQDDQVFTQREPRIHEWFAVAVVSREKVHGRRDGNHRHHQQDLLQPNRP